MPQCIIIIIIVIIREFFWYTNVTFQLHCSSLVATIENVKRRSLPSLTAMQMACNDGIREEPPDNDALRYRNM